MQLDPDPLLAQSVADGRYEFERKLGQGGSGVVYLVRDRETGERLAWKQLQRTDERSISRLKREFRTLANINHRNLVRLYDLGRTPDAWFLTMAYLDGPTMLDYLDGNASISSAALRQTGTVIGADAIDVPRIAGVFQQLATGVQALHAVGVLHRDLKPSNVIVERGRVVVLDFGLALWEITRRRSRDRRAHRGRGRWQPVSGLPAGATRALGAERHHARLARRADHREPAAARALRGRAPAVDASGLAAVGGSESGAGDRARALWPGAHPLAHERR